jgi:hypothetical protein
MANCGESRKPARGSKQGKTLPLPEESTRGIGRGRSCFCFTTRVKEESNKKAVTSSKYYGGQTIIFEAAPWHYREGAWPGFEGTLNGVAAVAKGARYALTTLAPYRTEQQVLEFKERTMEWTRIQG